MTKGQVATALGVTLGAGLLAYGIGRTKSSMHGTALAQKYGRDAKPLLRALSNRHSTFVTVGAAFSEESAFRWGFLPVMEARIGTVPSVLLSSALFGLGHWSLRAPWWRVPEAALGGVGYAGVFLAGRRIHPIVGLLASTAVHALHNFGVKEGYRATYGTIPPAFRTAAQKRSTTTRSRSEPSW